MVKTTFFVVLLVAPLVLTIIAPTFRSSFDKVAPATIYALSSIWRYRGKDEEKRHS